MSLKPSKLPNRRSIRLPNYDYSTPGYYFVTICVKDRECLLGKIQNSTITSSPIGSIVERTWRELPSHFPSVQLDAFAIMPNHLHGILIVGATFMAPGLCKVGSNGAMDEQTPKLGEIVRRFKSFSTHRIRQNHLPSFSWQRNYYEHVIRKDESLDNHRRYILDNPLKWELDEENPDFKE
jgi:putative transposase